MRKSFDARVVVGGHPDFYGLSVILDELNNATGRQVRFFENVENLVDEALLVAQR